MKIVEKQLNEIINIISDSRTTNIIAILSLIVAFGALLFSIISNYKSNKRYIDSLKPLLSFELYQTNGILLLAIKNTGMSEAKKIRITINEIFNNGNNKDLVLDDIFKNEFMLYPTEEVQGTIAMYDNSIDTVSFPCIDLNISYIEGNDSKNINYSRTVSFKRNIYSRNQLSRIEDSIESISYSNNRLANYIEGRTFFTFDRINALPKSSLYKDIKDALNCKKTNPKNRHNKN